MRSAREPASRPGAVARLITALQHVLPQHALSRIVRHATRLRWRWWKNALIHAFMRRFDVDMTSAAQPDASAYPSFNAFFTRALAPGARPLCADAVVSPVDGAVSEIGVAIADRLLQVKGRSFGIADLLGGDHRHAQPFNDGAYAVLYLSPRDYHRIHMPLAGTLTASIHVPGALFAVNRAATYLIPRLFTRNERVCALFDTAAGPMAVVMVGALFVGSIETVWGGARRSRRHGAPALEHAPAIQLDAGAELGRFNMGSTVIVMFGRERVRWLDSVIPGTAVTMGQAIGRRANG